MIIDPTHRWLILGKTGSGKTELVKYLLREVSMVYPIVIIDPNELWLGRGKGRRAREWANNREKGTIDKPHLIKNAFNPKFWTQCLQPDEDEMYKLEKVVAGVMKKEDVFIYFDETEGIATATHVPKFIRVLWKRGRAHHVGAWAATQVPKGIPRIFKSQAEHFIIMKVGIEDADVAAEIAHVNKKVILGLKPYEWIYYNHDMDVGEFHPPIPYKEKK
jgi:energy-coupling factor transporter ATP-binding protein EcfA2